MDSIEVRQRIAYLIEHGGLWEQAQDQNNRMHTAIVLLLAVDIALEVALLMAK